MGQQDERRHSLEQWAVQQLAAHAPEWQVRDGLDMVSGDASFRRYFRLHYTKDHQKNTLIAVDAPPDKENSRPFVAIAKALHAHGVCVPNIIAVDFDRGFMVQEDFGDSLLRPQLSEDRVDALYAGAMQTLQHMQSCQTVSGYALPPYDKQRLGDEMALIRDWFMERFLALTLTDDERAIFQTAFTQIAEAVSQQPQVFVHRDYHSRNLMLLEDGRLGVIDFQDAVTGPITYDLVSLLRDAYVEWPDASVRKWVDLFAEELRKDGVLSADNATFQQWFDWMGAQRHLKVVGIFARLSLRDGKHGYLNDIPLVFDYLLSELSLYPALSPLFELLRQRALPAYLQKTPTAAARLSRWLP